jgi:hypothetical protein
MECESEQQSWHVEGHVDDVHHQHAMIVHRPQWWLFHSVNAKRVQEKHDWVS